MSSYNDVAQALLDSLSAVGGFKVMRGVQLQSAGDEWIAIGGIEDGHHEIPTMKTGRKRREETYKLIANVSVVRGGRDPASAETRAIEIMTEVEDLLADSPNLGLVQYPTMRITLDEFDLDSFMDESRAGWRTMMVLKLLVQVRLN